MKTLIFKHQHSTSVFAQLIDSKKQIDYMVEHILPFVEYMHLWEQKEYLAVYNAEKANFESLKATVCVKENESIFNDVLSSYNLSVATFIAYVEKAAN